MVKEASGYDGPQAVADNEYLSVGVVTGSLV